MQIKEGSAEEDNILQDIHIQKPNPAIFFVIYSKYFQLIIKNMLTLMMIYAFSSRPRFICLLLGSFSMKSNVIIESSCIFAILVRLFQFGYSCEISCHFLQLCQNN